MDYPPLLKDQRHRNPSGEALPRLGWGCVSFRRLRSWSKSPGRTPGTFAAPFSALCGADGFFGWVFLLCLAGADVDFWYFNVKWVEWKLSGLGLKRCWVLQFFENTVMLHRQWLLCAKPWPSYGLQAVPPKRIVSHFASKTVSHGTSSKAPPEHLTHLAHKKQDEHQKTSVTPTFWTKKHVKLPKKSKHDVKPTKARQAAESTVGNC